MADEEMNVYYILNVCGARARTKYALLTSCFPPLFAPAILGLSFASVEFCTLRCLPNQIGPSKSKQKWSSITLQNQYKRLHGKSTGAVGQRTLL